MWLVFVLLVALVIYAVALMVIWVRDAIRLDAKNKKH